VADPASIVRRLIEEGFNRGDLRILDDILDPGYIEHQSVAPGVPRTREAVRAMIRALRTGFPDVHLSIEALDAVGDRVWLRIRATGTHKGPFMGSPPTGRTMSIDVLDQVRVSGGRIVEHWGVPDHLSLLEQLGL
jgi:predicted ester cyclase